MKEISYGSNFLTVYLSLLKYILAKIQRYSDYCFSFYKEKTLKIKQFKFN
jgi:hypothetical protein